MARTTLTRTVLAAVSAAALFALGACSSDAGTETGGGGETSAAADDGVITLHEEECLGACEKAPVVSIDFVYHDDVTPERMVELIRMLQAGEVPEPSRGAQRITVRHQLKQKRRR